MVNKNHVGLQCVLRTINIYLGLYAMELNEICFVLGIFKWIKTSIVMSHLSYIQHH